VALQRFPGEFQCGVLIPALDDDRLEHLTFVIDSQPEIAALPIDLREQLVDMSTPVAGGAHSIHAIVSDFGCEHPTKTTPPKPNRLVADVGSSLMKEIFHIGERKRRSDVHCHGEADDPLMGS